MPRSEVPSALLPKGKVNHSAQIKVNITCCECRKDKPGTKFSWYQFRKKNEFVSQRRCMACTDRRRTELYDEAIRKFRVPRLDDDVWDAARLGNIAKILMDLDAGLHFDRKNPRTGRTQLQDAAAHGHVELCEFLLDHNADVNTRALIAKETALHMAVWADNLEIMSMLLAFGADPGIKNKYGQIPLHYTRSKATCRALLWVQTTHVVYDTAGKTPTDKCRERGDVEVLEFIADIETKRVIAAQKRQFAEAQAKIDAVQAKSRDRQAKLEAKAEESAVDRATREYMQWKSGTKNVGLAQVKERKEKRSSLSRKARANEQRRRSMTLHDRTAERRASRALLPPPDPALIASHLARAEGAAGDASWRSDETKSKRSGRTAPLSPIATSGRTSPAVGGFGASKRRERGGKRRSVILTVDSLPPT